MPVGEHFEGHGDEVMRSMRRTYGPEGAKRVFYATEKKRAKKRKGKRKSRRK